MSQSRTTFLQLAGAGIVAGIAYGGYRSMTKRNQIKFSGLSTAETDALNADPTLSNLCDRFGLFRRDNLDLLQHSCIFVLFCRDVDKGNSISFGSIRVAATLISNIVEAIRTMRCDVDAKQHREFDEVAADFQKYLNDKFHNLQFTIEHTMINK